MIEQIVRPETRAQFFEKRTENQRVGKRLKHRFFLV
jgi:hypothetical protein